MDKTAGTDPNKAVESPADGGKKPTPEKDGQLKDDRAARPGGPPLGEGKPAEPMAPRLRPEPASPWAPGGMSAAPAPPPSSSGLDARKAPDPSPRAPRKAHLVLRRVEPWSAMKFSFVVSLVCFVVLFVAVAVLYMVLSGLGVFDNIIQTVNQFTVSDGKPSNSGFNIASWFEPVRILGYTALIGAVNVVLITALSTLGAVIYNIASDLVGGVEVTFSEAE
ncbi:hypothetical protein GCM10017673_09780 [Streptosporangium violaceochromogenes]|nr:hypothetical protein GCM10017673_09780 [Streptosporangium violaceochromogenes]